MADCKIENIDVIKDPKTGETIGVVSSDILQVEKINFQDFMCVLKGIHESLEAIRKHLEIVTDEEGLE